MAARCTEFILLLYFVSALVLAKDGAMSIKMREILSKAAV
jgi:hypothetical protein